MTRATMGSVKSKNEPSILICTRSFFQSGATGISRAMKRAKKSYRTVAPVTVFAVIAIALGALLATSPALAQEESMPEQVVPLAAAPVRLEESTYLSVIPFETVTYPDPELYAGETAVVTEGRDGVRKVTQLFEYEGDQLSSVTAVSSTIVIEAVAETIAVGTLERPLTASYGTYIWPAEGVISSYFGKRSGTVGSSNHQGIDISGKKGDSIYAADGGLVIRADSKLKGYGKLIQIEHDNGDITYYAHNSELLVSEGDRVYQGQEIARMGSTGVSSGVHLHFEVRINGTPVNPTKYLP